MRTGRPTVIKWTPGQDAMIRVLYQEWGPTDLALRMKVPVGLLKSRAHRLGVWKTRTFYWTPALEDMVRERYQKDGPNKLAGELGISPPAVIAKAIRLGIGPTRRRPKEWTEEMLTVVKDRYATEGPTALAERFGVSPDCVRGVAKSLGLDTSCVGHIIAGRIRAENSTSCDIRYFDQWSPNMAYILGFTFADGNVDKHLSGFGYCLSAKDEDILHFIKKELKATKEVFRDEHVKDGRGWKTGVRATFSIGSGVLARRLVELGCKPRKTYNDDPFPHVPDNMMPHFVRGYLDGDGTTGSRDGEGNRGCCVAFVGSPKFITGLRNSLIRLARMSRVAVQIHRGKTTDYAGISWGGLIDIGLFREYAYPFDFSFCLERKKKNLDNWLLRPHQPKQKHFWTKEEDLQIRNFFHEVSSNRLAEILGRDKEEVLDRARKLGFRRYRIRNSGTADH